jgi:hypothetical protein
MGGNSPRFSSATATYIAEVVRLDLSDEEQVQLAVYESSRDGDRKWLEFYTVEVRIDIWRAFAQDVNTREWDVYDYTGAGLMWRTYLEGVLQETRPPLQSKLASVVGVIDDQFRAATEEDVSRLLGAFYKPDCWWLRRIPATGPIRAALDAERRRDR